MPQSGSGGPRNGGESPPPTWQPRQPQYEPFQQQQPEPPQQQPQYQAPQYSPQYDQQYPALGAHQHDPYQHDPYQHDPYQQGADQRNRYQQGLDQQGPYQHDSYQQGPSQQEGYPQESYQQDGYQQGAHQQAQYPPGGGFRNPRTGSDYRRGDDYTMPVTAGPYTTPGPYAPDPYAQDPYAQDHYVLDPYAGSGQDEPPGGRGRRGGRGGRPRKHRIRRFLRRPTVRVVLGLLLIFFCWVGFSLGQALTANNGLSMSAKLAEWARDHYLGPVVTLMEQWTYTPPSVGGKPKFSLTDPQGKLKFKKEHGFTPDVPKTLAPFAHPALAGEGAWRLQETVRGEPALFTTFLRVNAVNTSYVAGLASFDQRLVKFELRPGSQDPGSGFGGGQSWIPPGTRTGLLATFNGGFRLYASEGGFYLNGHTSGTLTNGAASMVYYRNGTIKVGEWGRDVSMTPDVVGVRQNLKLIVDHGQVAADINQNVESNFGATLGGTFAVWRSGIGITKDNRIVYVYGPALSAANLADLLQRAGAVEAMELDINPEWTTFEYYKANGNSANPAPAVLLPTQQSAPDRYYSVWARDFTAVYAK